MRGIPRLVRACALAVAASDVAGGLPGSVPACVEALPVKTSQVRDRTDAAVGITASQVPVGTTAGVRRNGRSSGPKAGAAVVARVRDVLATAAQRLGGNEKTPTYRVATVPSDAPLQAHPHATERSTSLACPAPALSAMDSVKRARWATVQAAVGALNSATRGTAGAYRLSSGTLLGWYRDCDVTDNDVDFDVDLEWWNGPGNLTKPDRTLQDRTP